MRISFYDGFNIELGTSIYGVDSDNHTIMYDIVDIRIHIGINGNVPWIFYNKVIDGKFDSNGECPLNILVSELKELTSLKK